MKKTKKTTRKVKRAQPEVRLTEERFRLAPIVLRLTEDNSGVIVPNRIQLFRTGTFKKLMPDGRNVTFSITRETLESILQNFKDNVRGVDIALDFAHKSDEEAAGWFKSLELEQDGDEATLWAEIEWTPDGHAAVGGKKFRYISPDFAFSWTDNESGKKYGPTLFGAGLTNRPVIKNMAPTVELTEVKDMAKKIATKKKISEMTVEELELLLAETKDEEKRELIQLRLDEMSEDDDSDDGDSDSDDDEDEDDGDEDDGGTTAAKQNKKPAPQSKKVKAAAKKGAGDEMNMDELKAAYQKACDELADIRKGMAKQLAETERREKEATFAMLLAEGKVVPAQKEAFFENDTIKFAELAQTVKFTTVGAHGANASTTSTSAQDEVLKLADQVVKDGKVAKRTEAISYVLSENPELHKRYMKEMEGGARVEN